MKGGGEQPEEPKTNIIIYTTSDGKPLSLGGNGTGTLNNKLLKNTYESGKGTLEYEKELTYVDFADQPKLTSIELPGTVQSVYFPNCTGLTEIVIPEKVEQISAHAFEGCYNLISVTFNGNVKIINEYAFSECTRLSQLSLPGVVYIGKRAFQYCTSLSTVELPGSLNQIGEEAFLLVPGVSTDYVIGTELLRKAYYWGCISVNGIDITNRSNTIFYETIDNSSVDFMSIINIAEMDNRYIDELGLWCAEFETDITGFTEEYGSMDLNQKQQLKSIFLPSTLEYIDNNVFTDSGLEEVIFYSNIKEEGGSDRLLRNYSSLKRIGNSAFAECHNLRKIRLPYSLTWIEENAFIGTEIETLIIDNVENRIFWNEQGNTPFDTVYELILPQTTYKYYLPHLESFIKSIYETTRESIYQYEPWFIKESREGLHIFAAAFDDWKNRPITPADWEGISLWSSELNDRDIKFRNGYYYIELSQEEIDNSGTVTEAIWNHSYNRNPSSIILPEGIHTLSMDEHENGCLENCNCSLILPESLGRIEPNAIKNSTIKSLYIPDNALLSIDPEAFNQVYVNYVNLGEGTQLRSSVFMLDTNNLEFFNLYITSYENPSTFMDGDFYNTSFSGDGGIYVPENVVGFYTDFFGRRNGFSNLVKSYNRNVWGVIEHKEIEE